MIDLGALKITIETGADKAKQELNDVGETAEKQQSKFSKFGDGLKKGALIGVGAVTALSGALVSTAMKAVDTAGELDDISNKTGVAAESFQKWAYASKLCGMEQETLEKAMIKSQTSFADAKAGSETMSAAYQALGLDINNIGSSSEAFDLVIERLAGMEDETQRNAIANDIFGKTYAELSPLLNEGAEGINKLKQEAVDMGAVMSNDAVKSGAEFGDQIDALKMSFNGAMNEIGTQFMPVLKTLLAWILAHMPEIKSVISTVFTVIGSVVTTAGNIFSALMPIFDLIFQVVQTTFPIVQDVIEVTFGAIGKAVKAVTDIFWGIVDAIKAAVEWLQSWNDTDAKDKDVSTSNKKKVNGSHANGLDYVPYNGYIAELHEGERVLTAQQNAQYNYGSNITITGNSFIIREEADIQKIGRELYRQLTTKQRGAMA